MNISLAIQYLINKKFYKEDKFSFEWNIPFFFLNDYYKNLQIFNDFSNLSLIFLNFSQIYMTSDYGYFELKRNLVRKELIFLKKETEFLFFSASKYKNFSIWHNYKWFYEKEYYFLPIFSPKFITKICVSDPKNLHFQNFFQFLLDKKEFLIWEKIVWLEILTMSDFFSDFLWNLKLKVFLRSKIFSSDLLNYLSSRIFYEFSQAIPYFIQRISDKIKIKNGFSILGLGILSLEFRKNNFANLKYRLR